MVATTPKMKALQNLSNSLPVANSKVAAGQDAARQMQIQNAVKAAPVTSNTATVAQSTGATAATQTGQQMVQGAQQQLQQQGQVAQLGQAEQARQGQGEVAGLQAGAKDEAMDNVSRLAALDSRAKDELYDKQMKFAQDENGRTLFNEHQLADYARMNATSDEELKNYSDKITQMSQRKMKMMEIAFNKIDQDLNFKYAQAKQAGDQAAAREIEQMRADMEEKKRAAKTELASSTMIGGALGTVIGAVIGGVATESPVGAVAGGAAGGALGSSAGAAAAG